MEEIDVCIRDGDNCSSSNEPLVVDDYNTSARLIATHELQFTDIADAELFVDFHHLHNDVEVRVYIIYLSYFLHL